MSKENALRFLMLLDRDEELKAKHEEVANKYKGKRMTQEEMEKLVKEELVLLAKDVGYEFSLEEMEELEKSTLGKLSDEELEKAVGGAGKVILPDWKFYCAYAPDDKTLRAWLDSWNVDCPYHEGRGTTCWHCKNLVKDGWSGA